MSPKTVGQGLMAVHGSGAGTSVMTSEDTTLLADLRVDSAGNSLQAVHDEIDRRASLAHDVAARGGAGGDDSDGQEAGDLTHESHLSVNS